MGLIDSFGHIMEDLTNFLFFIFWNYTGSVSDSIGGQVYNGQSEIIFIGTGTSEGIPRVSCLTNPDKTCQVSLTLFHHARTYTISKLMATVSEIRLKTSNFFLINRFAQRLQNLVTGIGDLTQASCFGSLGHPENVTFLLMLASELNILILHQSCTKPF